MLSMAACTDCSAALEPQWKFCVRCGAVVERAGAPIIPAAIRPDRDDDQPTITPLSLFLWGLGALLALLALVAISLALFVRS